MSALNSIDAGPDLNLLCDAVEAVVKAGDARAGLIQRRVRVGFAKAGRLLELLEAAGVIGPFVGDGKRRVVLVPVDQLPAVLADLRGEVSRG